MHPQLLLLRGPLPWPAGGHVRGAGSVTGQGVLAVRRLPPPSIFTHPPNASNHSRPANPHSRPLLRDPSRPKRTPLTRHVPFAHGWKSHRKNFYSSLTLKCPRPPARRSTPLRCTMHSLRWQQQLVDLPMAACLATAIASSLFCLCRPPRPPSGEPPFKGPHKRSRCDSEPPPQTMPSCPRS